jgi:hypothetical protein
MIVQKEREVGTGVYGQNANGMQQCYEKSVQASYDWSKLGNGRRIGSKNAASWDAHKSRVP